GERTPMPTMHFPPFRLDLAAGQLWRAARPVALRPKTFGVLHYLASRAGELVTKEELLDAVWASVAVTGDVVRISIGELRRALDDDPEAPRFIVTVHGRGYRFAARLADLPGEPPPGEPEVGGTSIVGREAELATLRQWLDDSRRGERVVGL